MNDKHEPNSASDTVTTTNTTMDEQRVSSTASEATPAATTVEIQQAAEIERILNTSPLDPYAVLGYKLPYTSIELTSVKAQYRKLSRYVHPDRCKHEQARDAFERLKRADADIEDDEKRTTFLEAVGEAYLEVIYQKNLSVRRLQHDQPSTEATTTTTTAQASSKGPSLAALRPANTATNGASSQSLQQQLRNTQAPELGTDKVFDKMVLDEARRSIADKEWKRRQKIRAEAEAEARKRKLETDAVERLTKRKQDDKQWESGQEERVNNWRSFLTKRQTKRK